MFDLLGFSLSSILNKTIQNLRQKCTTFLKFKEDSTNKEYWNMCYNNSNPLNLIKYYFQFFEINTINLIYDYNDNNSKLIWS